MEQFYSTKSRMHALQTQPANALSNQQTIQAAAQKPNVPHFPDQTLISVIQQGGAQTHKQLPIHFIVDKVSSENLRLPQNSSNQGVLPKISSLTSQQVAKPSPKNFVGLPALKQKQQAHLHKLQQLAKEGAWQHLQTHTMHQDSGFDWWMFPVNRASASYGDDYNIGQDDIEILKKDPEFMENYRAGVVLIAKSWGWDLIGNTDVSDKQKRWVDYPVRLGKMLQSLTLFGQKDLHDSLVSFVNKANIHSSLEDWIQNYLAPIQPLP